MFASHHGLDRLTFIIDKNGLQGFGRTESVMNLGSLANKWESFGFDVREINGHDFKMIDDALKSPAKRGKPRCIVAHTVKGKGVSFMEDRLEWHYHAINATQLEQALKELDEAESRLQGRA